MRHPFIYLSYFCIKNLRFSRVSLFEYNMSNINQHQHSHEKYTRWVVYITAITMVVEIIYGYTTNSMALLADGYHMASHVLALGLTWVAYIVSRNYSSTTSSSFSNDKLLALTGFTSALMLFGVAVFMAIYSIERFYNPLEINFKDALVVAVVGLVVNMVSALFLHQNHEHHDHNIRSAYLHVLADGLTSVAAILALLGGMYFNIAALDSISGIISSIIISKWAVGLLIQSGRVLIDFKKH